MFRAINFEFTDHIAGFEPSSAQRYWNGQTNFKNLAVNAKRIFSMCFTILWTTDVIALTIRSV